MKKTFLFVGLALTVAGSWACYPKAAEPGGYMMVISSFTPNCSITIISPTGEMVSQGIDSKTSSVKQRVAANQELLKAEVRKVNELRQAGWKVISASARPNDFAGSGDYVYVLEK